MHKDFPKKEKHRMKRNKSRPTKTSHHGRSSTKTQSAFGSWGTGQRGVGLEALVYFSSPPTNWKNTSGVGGGGCDLFRYFYVWDESLCVFVCGSFSRE